MRGGVSLQTRREFLQHMLPQYRKASSVKKKSKLLDAFTVATGYNRKYALWLLNHAKEGQSTPQRPRPRHYGPEVQHALFLVWLVANPERSSGDIFRELQRRSPGRYQPLQIRTLQRGMRKIRASPARKPLRSNGKLK